MAKYFALLALWSVSVFGQNSAVPLTNETIIRLVASGVPAETIINTIRGASAVNFGFLPNDLALLQRYSVPDDVVKAMAAKSNGRPIPGQLPASSVQPDPMERPGLAAESTKEQSPLRPAKSQRQIFDITIIDRQDSQTGYSYVVPGHSNSISRTNVNCSGGETNVNCYGSTNTSRTSTPPHRISYEVRGATLSLRLPDGRIAVVNCESKYALKMDYINRRSCRIPLVNEVQTEFDGNKAKLKWSVSIDGNKLESETYKILGILDKE